MRFSVLGPLRVEIDGRPLAIDRPRWRSVLAYLLVNTDRPVATDKVISAIWGDHPVPTAATQVHTAVSAIRRLLRSHGTDDIIHNRPSGYVLSVQPRCLDLAEFSNALVSARRSQDEFEIVDDLRRALALWSGPALDGVNGAFVDAARARLEEERVSAFERLVDIEMARGNHRDITAELIGHLDDHPLRESLVHRLMAAMYHSGRKSDALREYARLRERLTAELGVEPGPDLRELHLEILRDGPKARSVERVDSEPRAAVRLTRLPPPSPVFTGRVAERSQLYGMLADRSTAVTVAIHGPGGAGKSSMVIAVAHDLAPMFPGGRTYVDLHGSTPGLRPLSSVEVLRCCLESFGVTEKDVPVGEADAVERLRALCRASRSLIILDNAVSAAQVEPVIRALGSGAVVITSRAPLPIAATLSMRVERLSPSDAIALLDRVAGRSGADWSDLGRIAAHCDHLPLALCVAGGRLAREPDLSVDRLANSLADHRSRLDSLEVDGVGVRSSIRVGYDLIAAGSSSTDRLATETFHAIGVLPLVSFDAAMVAAVLQPDGPTLCDAALARLARAQLVHADGDGHYRAHDMVRAVAAECAEQSMTADARRDVQRRAAAYYAACAIRADELLRPARRDKPDRVDPETLTAASLLDRTMQSSEDVGPWLDVSLPNIVAASHLAVELGGASASHAVTIVDSLGWALRKRGEYHREHAISSAAVVAAERIGDRAIQRRALIHLGRVEIYLRQYESASAHIDRALVSARADGDTYARVSALNDLSLAMIHRDDLSTARALLLECIDIISPTEARVRIGLTAIHNLALVEGLLGEWEPAIERLSAALVQRRRIGDRAGEGVDLVLLGVIRCAAGQVDPAIAELTYGLEICEDLGNRADTWFALVGLALAHLRQGRYLEAVAIGHRGLSAARSVARPTAERATHRILAHAYEGALEVADARLHARQCAAIDSVASAPEDDLIARVVNLVMG